MNNSDNYVFVTEELATKELATKELCTNNKILYSDYFDNIYRNYFENKEEKK